MATLREWVMRLWGTLRPSRRDAELEAELRLHLELAAEDERRRAPTASRATPGGQRRSGPGAWRRRWRRCAISAVCRGSTISLATCATGFVALRRNPLFASVAVADARARHRREHGDFLARGRRAPPGASRQQPARARRASSTRSRTGTSSRSPPPPPSDLAPDRDALSGLAAFRPLLNTPVSVNGEAELAHDAAGVGQLPRGARHPRRASDGR